MLYQLSYSRLLYFMSKNQCGGDRIRTYSDVVTRFTVWPGSPTPAHPLQIRADGGIRTPDPLITNQLLWPTELHRQNINYSYFEEHFLESDCKNRRFLRKRKQYFLFF